MRLRTLHCGAQKRRPDVLVCGAADHEQAPSAPQRRLTRRNQARCHRHEAIRPGDAGELANDDGFARAGRPPDRGRVRPRAAGRMKHFRQRRHCRPFNNPQSVIRNPQSAIRNFRFLRVARARVGNPYAAAAGGNADRVRTPFPGREAARAQPSSRARVHRLPIVAASPCGSASPRFESRRLANEAEVHECRDGVMTQRPKHGAALRPPQLLRHASGAADSHRHARAGRKIARAPVVVHCKSIRYELHGRRRCKTSARANRAAERGVGVQRRQIFRIE